MWDYITLRELCKILEADKITRIFYVRKEDIDKKNIIGTICVLDELCTDIDYHKYDQLKIYDSSGTGIYIPDVNIADFIALSKQHNFYSYKSISYNIDNKFHVKQEDKDLYYTVSCILHEIGHWRFYIYCRKKCKMSDEEFYRQDIERRSPVLKKDSEILQSNYNDSLKAILNQKNNRKYREIPAEYEADQYAYRNLAVAMDRIKTNLLNSSI